MKSCSHTAFKCLARAGVGVFLLLYMQWTVARESSVPALSVDAVVGCWELSSGGELEVRYNARNECEIYLDGSRLHSLEQGAFVKAAKFDAKRTLGLLLIDVFDISLGGRYYRRALLVLDEGMTESGVVEYLEVLGRAELEGVDGRARRVISVGSLEDFPIVSLYIGYDEDPNPPTRVVYEWQDWNIITCEKQPKRRQLIE